MTRPSSPGIDILLATFNGAQTLPAMLRALEHQAPTTRPWRVVAVDNASTDDTAAILRNFAGRLPIEIVREEAPGKTTALLTGSRHLRGDLTIFTDDDIIPGEDWLKRYEEAADAHPDCALFGGPIVPYPIEDLDPWWTVTDGFTNVLFAATDHPEGPVDAPAYIYGPNYMVRTSAAITAIGHMQGLGPDQSTTFTLGDETFAIERIVAEGARAWFVDTAPVRHQIRHRYTTLPYMLGRAERQGRGTVALRTRGPWDLKRRLGFLLDSSARAASLYFRQRGQRRDVPDQALFTNLFVLHFHIGAIRGALRGPFAARPNR